MDKATLVKQRGTIRTAVSKCITRVSDTLPSHQIQAIKTNLNRDLTRLEHFDQLIVNECEGDEIDSEIEESLNYKLKIQSVIIEIDNMLKPKATVSESPSIKLPKLQLPTFSGDKMEWQSFYDIFCTAVIKNPNLSEVQKFVYLHSCLKGSAKAIIAGMNLVDSNFAIAVDILRERFGSPRNAIKDHLHTLQEGSSLSENVEQMRHYLDQLIFHTRSLKRLGGDCDSYERVVLSVIMSKLTKNVQLSMCSRFGHVIETMENFLEAFEIEIKLRESVEEQFSPSKHPDKSKANEMRNEKYGTAIALTSSERGSIENVKKKCIFCAGEHKSSWCDKVKFLEDRLEFIKKEKLCFLCLKKNHSSKDCKFRQSCKRCSSRKTHHVSICPTIIKRKMETNNSESVKNTASVQVETVEPPKEAGQVMTTCGENWHVMISTAKAILLSPDGKSEIVIKLIMDTASSRTYIRQDLCNYLQIPTGLEEEWSVNTFGTKTLSHHASSRVDIRLKKINSDEVISLTANTVGVICNTHPSIDVKSIGQFKNLELADCFDERDSHLEIGMLIGADHYYDIVFGNQIIRGKDSNLVAVNSLLGWLLQGPAVPSGKSSNSRRCVTSTAMICKSTYSEAEHLH